MDMPPQTVACESPDTVPGAHRLMAVPKPRRRLLDSSKSSGIRHEPVTS